MAQIINPANFQLVPDILGAQTKGLILQQEQEKLRQLQQEPSPLQRQQTELGLQQKIQESELGLQTGRAQQPGIINEATIEASISGARQLKGITSREGKISFLEQQKQEFQQAGLGTRAIDGALALAQAGDFDELEIQTNKLIELGDKLLREGTAPLQSKREILKGADDINRFIDTGEPVFPGITPTSTTSTRAFLNLETGQVENLTDQQSAESQAQVVPLTELKELGLSRDAQGNLSLAFTPTDDPDQRQQKITSLAAQLKPVLGADAVTEATNVIDGLKRIVTSEDGTKVSLVDDTAVLRGDPGAAVTELQIKELASPERVPIPSTEGLFQQASKATGLTSGIVAEGANIAGLVGADIKEPFTEARQNLRVATNDLIRSLSINPRFPVGEIERIRSEVGVLPDLFRSPATLQKKMRALDTSLRIRMAQAKRDAADQRLPKGTREDQASNASNIDNFLNQLNVTQEIQADELQTIEDVDAFSREQLRSIDFGVVNNLPIEMQDEIRKRLAE